MAFSSRQCLRSLAHKDLRFERRGSGRVPKAPSNRKTSKQDSASGILILLLAGETDRSL